MKQEKQRNQQEKTAREIALEILYPIFEKQAFANLRLEKALAGYRIKPEDRALITEIVNGTVRMRLRLDWTLGHFLKKGMEKLNPWVRNILRLSAYQILFMERIPAHAAVSEAVRLTRTKASEGLTGLCNGVLRNLLREKDKIPLWLAEIKDPLLHDEVQYSMPRFLLKELQQILPGEQKDAVLQFLNTPAGVELRVNSCRLCAEELAEKLKAEGVETEVLPDVPGALRVLRTSGSLTETKAFREGDFYIQNRASQLAGLLASPQPGETVFDLCCGIGGKATHLAELSREQADITAVELYAHKLQLLLENCERLGLKRIHPLRADIAEGLPDFSGRADCVLLDVPCSGWGVLHRRADLRWGQTENQLRELEALQSRLLEQAQKLVKPGGRLLYTTCTIRPEENEKRILAFLADHPQYQPEGFADVFSGMDLSAEDRTRAAGGMLTLLPGMYGTDGMFYAKLRKSAE